MRHQFKVECKAGCSYEHKTDRAPVQCGMCGGYEVRVWQVVYDTLDNGLVRDVKEDRAHMATLELESIPRP